MNCTQRCLSTNILIWHTQWTNGPMFNTVLHFRMHFIQPQTFVLSNILRIYLIVCLKVNNNTYFFPQVGVGCFEQLLYLSSQVTAHFWGTHAAQGAQCQPLDVLCAMIQVTVVGQHRWVSHRKTSVQTRQNFRYNNTYGNEKQLYSMKRKLLVRSIDEKSYCKKRFYNRISNIYSEALSSRLTS